MTEEYKANWKEGTDYEKYVSRWIYEESVNLIHGYDSEEDQLTKGENIERIEIKKDNGILKYGNLCIEFKEKSNANNEFWADSGIYKKTPGTDNYESLYYAIGNEMELWFFKTSFLRKLVKDFNFETYETGTSIGIKLPIRLVEDSNWHLQKYSKLTDGVGDTIPF